MAQTKKKNRPFNLLGRTRKIIDTIRSGFKQWGRPKTLEVKKNEDVPKMDKVLLQPQVTFVLIKADWCGHCKEFEPKWQNLTKTPGRNANMIKIPVELQRNSQVLKNVPIDGVPTVLEVRNGTVRAIDIDEANDPEIMRQEVTRPSNVPINGAPIANAIVNESPNAAEEEEEAGPLVPTQNMEDLVNKVNQNPRNLGETNGSRANDQAALNLAVEAEPVNPVEAPKPINSINLADTIKPAMEPVAPIPAPVANQIPEPIPAPAPSPAPTPSPASLETGPISSIELTPPPVVDALMEQKTKAVDNVINQEQKAVEESNQIKQRQRGGAKRRSRKQKKQQAKLLGLLKQLTRKSRKI